MPEMASNKFEKYCEKLKGMLWDDLACLQAIEKACRLLDKIVAGDCERDRTKDSSIQTTARNFVEAELGGPETV